MNTHYILATAGHVDHGKSSLVKALTGIDPDRLPEEKARGITIDLGFAHLSLPATAENAAPQPSFELGIIDVPGHEDFVKNMVAGVGSIDAALLVVAADDGWMPQTEEHLQILSYLGVTSGVVALTKMDLAPDSLANRAASVRQMLKSSPFASAPIIPVSSITGAGLPELKQALARVLAATPPPPDIGKPRMPVDRVFTLKGIGIVATGVLTGGAFQKGQNVTLQPAGIISRIRSIQSHHREIESIPPGSRAALNLTDVSQQKAGAPENIQRGQVVTDPHLGHPSLMLDVLLQKSDRLQHVPKPAARPLKNGGRVRVHLGSGHFTARVALSLGGQVLPGQTAIAQLRSETPVFAFAGDRFIIRDWSERWTLAGGLVLDPDASRQTFRTDAQQRLLQQRAAAPESPEAFVLSQLERDHAIPSSRLLLKSRFSADDIVQELALLASRGLVIAAGDWRIHALWWKSLREQAAAAIDAEHRKNPQNPGLPLNTLRALLDPHLPAPELFNPFTADLCQKDFKQSGANILRASHRPALPAHLQTAGAKVRSALTAKPFEPPSRKELAPDALAQQALRFLLQTGEAIEISEDVVLSANAYSQLTQKTKQILAKTGSGTVSDLRQALGASRRIVVPLLERLDREGVTRRDGDKRTLRANSNERST